MTNGVYLFDTGGEDEGMLELQLPLRYEFSFLHLFLSTMLR